MKVLIADDSALICDAITHILQTFLFIDKIDIAGDGQAAVSKIQAEKYDVIVLDIMMPNLNGIKVLQVAKATDPKIKVIVYTNYPFPAYRDQCLKLGADYFLDKTTESQKLLNIFKSFMPDKSYLDKTSAI